MFQYNRFNNEIVLKGHPFHSIGGIIYIVMAIMVFRFFLEIDPSDDIGGYCFTIVWILTVIGFSICSFREAGSKVVLSEQGIASYAWLSKKFLKWDEIKDWGFSYSGRSRGLGESYYLYFSKTVFKIKNVRKKKLKGKMIKIEIFEAEYENILNDVISYCKERVDVKPFIGEM